MNGESFRRRAAARRRSAEPVTAPTASSDNIGIEATDNINDKQKEISAE